MIYLAQPFSAPEEDVRQWRFEAGCKAAAALLKAGFNTFAPVAHSHVIAAHGLDGMNHAFWMRMDRPYVEWCSVIAVLTLPGWRESKGVAEEIDLARKAGKPVVYIDPATVGVDVSTMPSAQTPCQEAACL